MYNTAKSSAMFFNFLKAKDIFYITTIHMSPSIFSHIYRPQRSWGKVMFLHVSVILFTRGWYPSMPCRSPSGGGYPSMPCRFPGLHPGGSLRGLARGVSRPTPRGKLRGLVCGGVSRPTPGGLQGGLQVHTQGCIPACTEADTHPPCRWLLLRAVCILLECILVV